MKYIAAIMVSLLVVLTACVPQEKNITSEQSIQDMVNEKPIETNITVVEENITKNATVAPPAADPNEKPVFNKKCRNAAIVYGGCKWTSDAKIAFDLKVGSASYVNIPGVWMFAYGDSGGIKQFKRTEKLLSGAIRTYNINYVDLVKEVGKIRRLEVMPIEVINGTEYTCENQKIYTIPETHCKPAEPQKVDYYGNPVEE